MTNTVKRSDKTAAHITSAAAELIGESSHPVIAFRCHVWTGDVMVRGSLNGVGPAPTR